MQRALQAQHPNCLMTPVKLLRRALQTEEGTTAVHVAKLCVMTARKIDDQFPNVVGIQMFAFVILAIKNLQHHKNVSVCIKWTTPDCIECIARNSFAANRLNISLAYNLIQSNANYASRSVSSSVFFSLSFFKTIFLYIFFVIFKIRSDENRMKRLVDIWLRSIQLNNVVILLLAFDRLQTDC